MTVQVADRHEQPDRIFSLHGTWISAPELIAAMHASNDLKFLTNTVSEFVQVFVTLTRRTPTPFASNAVTARSSPLDCICHLAPLAPHVSRISGAE